jgi:hypothetical protein
VIGSPSGQWNATKRLLPGVGRALLRRRGVGDVDPRVGVGRAGAGSTTIRAPA